MTSIARVSAIDLATVYEEFKRDDVKYLCYHHCYDYGKERVLGSWKTLRAGARDD